MRIVPRTRGRASSRIDWDRAGRGALVVALVVIALMYVGPIVNFLDERKGSARETAELTRLEREHRELRRELKELDTRHGLERVAREAGMVAEGEWAYVVRERRRSGD